MCYSLSSLYREPEGTWIRVTQKHRPPVHGPPLWTGSVDYLLTGPPTTPMDPSMDHLQNRIKKKKISLTACPINTSLVSVKFLAFIRWCTLGKCDRTGFSLGRKLFHCRSLHIFAIFVAVALLERPGSLRDLRFLSLCHFVYVWNSA